VYLLDSDAARCLCQYRLILELADALDCSLADFAILPQLRFQLKLGQPKAIEKLGSAEAVEVAEQLVAAATEVAVSANSANAMLLADRPDIDAGELILFAALCDEEDCTLITGDKRALIALSAFTQAPIGAIWPRLICLEEAIAVIIKHNGLATVSMKIRARPEVNTAITLAFGHSLASPLSEVLEGLSSYVSDLMRATHGKYQLKHFPKHGICLNCC
jgi:hypothetical protein